MPRQVMKGVTCRGCAMFPFSGRLILGRWTLSEKYVGDLLLQKLYTVDHITHRQVKNDGAVPSYYFLKAAI